MELIEAVKHMKPWVGDSGRAACAQLFSKHV